jgi:hypothetical protein
MRGTKLTKRNVRGANACDMRWRVAGLWREAGVNRFELKAEVAQGSNRSACPHQGFLFVASPALQQRHPLAAPLSAASLSATKPGEAQRSGESPETRREPLLAHQWAFSQSEAKGCTRELRAHIRTREPVHAAVERCTDGDP